MVSGLFFSQEIIVRKKAKETLSIGQDQGDSLFSGSVFNTLSDRLAISDPAFPR
jgi:hypothetical protein